MMVGLVVAALAAGTAAAPASAADYGAGSLQLRGGGKSLKAQGVRWSAPSPAKVRSNRTRAVLPVESGTVTTVATLGLRGKVRLTAGKRRLTLDGLQLRLGGRNARLTGQLDGGKRRTLGRLKIAGKRLKLDRDAATVSVSDARLTLTSSTAKAVKRKLRLRHVPRGAVAAIAASGHVKDAPAPSSCSAEFCATGLGAEPPVMARPDGAVDVGSATLTWHVLDSFVRYISSGEGITASGGASNGPREVLPGSSSSFVYSYRFPFKEGWYDAASGRAWTTFRGKLRFRFAAHTIDMSAAEPEVEINGKRSRVIFRMDGRDGTKLGGTRGILLDLDLAKAESTTVSPDGKTRTYVRVPGKIPAKAGGSVFAGFYGPGESFGAVTLSLTTK